MIIASDITTLEQRGRYNGFIGAMLALGNGLGPLIGGALTQRSSWRWCFWFIVPLIVAVMIIMGLTIPPSNVKGKAWAKFRMIDWLGLLINIAAVLLTLVSWTAFRLRTSCISLLTIFCLLYLLDSSLGGRLAVCMAQSIGHRYVDHRRRAPHSLCVD